MAPAEDRIISIYDLPRSSRTRETSFSSSPSAALTQTRPFMPTATSNGNCAPSLGRMGFFGDSRLHGKVRSDSVISFMAAGRGKQRTRDSVPAQRRGPRTRRRARQIQRPSGWPHPRTRSRVPKRRESRGGGRRRSCRPAARVSVELAACEAHQTRLQVRLASFCGALERESIETCCL